MALDMDGDGDISTKELEKLLRSLKSKLKMSERDIKNALKEFDPNGDGSVTTEEFMNKIANSKHREAFHKALIQRSAVRKIFEKYDVDGSGTISRDEFKKAVEDKYRSKLKDYEIDNMMDAADKNEKDGLIDYEEFLKAFSYFPVAGQM